MSLTITANANYGPLGGSFNGAVFGDLDFLPPPGAQLIGLTLLSSTFTGFDSSMMGVISPDSFWVDFHGITVGQGQSATIGFETAAVPVPGALWLLGSGLLGLAGLRRKVKR